MDLEKIFPHPSFRKHQKSTLKKAIVALNDQDKDVALIEAPVGSGKSANNIAIANYFSEGKSFYTSPQRTLVKQLQEDYCPSGLAIDGEISDTMALLGRQNYKCRQSLQMSDKCDFRKSKIPCSEREDCTYNKQKEACKEANTIVTTFAMLITDSYLKLKKPSASFDNRELLIIDEAHSIEEDTASMFAGIEFSPSTLPEEVWIQIHDRIPHSEKLKDHIDLIDKVDDLCIDYAERLDIEPDDKDKVRHMTSKIEYFRQEMDNRRTWVVDLNEMGEWSRLTSRQAYVPTYTPIKVDRFLMEKVWSRADKIVLSTARFPFRGNIKRWLRRIGLRGVEYEFISVPMTFPKENRPIITRYMGGKMTNKKEEKHWDVNVNTVNNIINYHTDERGVIHTQSYKRANRLATELDTDSYYVHDRREKGDVITNWLKSGKRVLLSPAIKEGVDLIDEKCRFQILFKVPYPHIYDSRVEFIVKELNDWKWYYDKTAEGIVQSVGRGVRSDTDFCFYYVVDGSFKDVMRKCDVPDWFEEAVGLAP